MNCFHPLWPMTDFAITLTKQHDCKRGNKQCCSIIWHTQTQTNDTLHRHVLGTNRNAQLINLLHVLAFGNLWICPFIGVYWSFSLGLTETVWNKLIVISTTRITVRVYVSYFKCYFHLSFCIASQNRTASAVHRC